MNDAKPRAEFNTIRIEPPLAPFRLLLHPQEFETRYPSFRCQVDCIIDHPTGRFRYEASDVWFSTEGFDRLLTDLGGVTRGEAEQARLRDLSDFVEFRIEQRQGKTTAFFSVFEPMGSGEARFSFTLDIDPDVPASLLRSLREYQRWW